MESMIEAINKRISTRTYAEKPIEEEKKEVILELLRSNTVGPFGNRMRFELLDFDELARNEIKTLGTYGIIRGAKLFIVGATVLSDKAMEDFGYCLEKIVLKVTNLGLGTCWMGGTFKRSSFAKKINVADNEKVPVISPVGYPRHKRALVDKAVRFVARSNKRKEWKELFFDGSIEMPLGRDRAKGYTVSLESVRAGPSASNKQPWRIIKKGDENTFHFYLQRTKGYDKITSKEFSLQDIDMGIALCHFELSAVETGLAGKWEDRKPDSDFGDMEYIVSWMG